MKAEDLKLKGYVQQPNGEWSKAPMVVGSVVLSTVPAVTHSNRVGQSSKPLMNKLESAYKALLASRGVTGILEQSITLRLDPPFRSYRPDLAYMNATGGIVFVEVKGPHRFREKGIAKAALAAKTYPMFSFVLADKSSGGGWRESVLTGATK